MTAAMSSWVPLSFVILLAALALTWASSPPVTAKGKRWWMVSFLLFGSAAIAGAVWQGRSQGEDAGAVAGTTTSPLPAARETDDRSKSELRQRIKALETQVKLLEAGRQVRTLSRETADQFASYLKPFGSRRVIVSCAPDDLEAYQYANQLVNVLRAAGWDGQGPQATKIFGDVRAPAINVYVSSDDSSDTAKILLDGFAKFNIPYQSRVAPSQALPDNAPVELFVGTKQSDKRSASGN